MNAVGTRADQESRTQLEVRSKTLLSQSPFVTAAMLGSTVFVVADNNERVNCGLRYPGCPTRRHQSDPKSETRPFGAYHLMRRDVPLGASGRLLTACLIPRRRQPRRSWNR